MTDDMPDIPKSKKDPRYDLMRAQEIADTLSGAIKSESRYSGGVTVKQLTGALELLLLRIYKKWGNNNEVEAWAYLRDELMETLVQHEFLMPTNKKV